MTVHSAMVRHLVRATFGVLAAAGATPRAVYAQDTATVGRPDSTITRLPSGGAITLNEAIRIALARNSTVLLARNAARLDSLGVRQARNQFLPNLGASSQSSQGVGAGSQGQNAFSTSVGLSSSITLYNGRQNANLLRQAEFALGATRSELDRSRQTVVFVVATDFLNLITQQEQLRVQRENLAAQEEELTQLERFVRVGTRPIGDLYQQQAAVASTRLAVVNARRATEVAKVDLIEELLLDPRLDYTFETPAAQQNITAPSFNLDSLIAVALQQRVDVRAQALRVQAAEREVAIAEGGRLPVVTGNGGFSTAYGSTGDAGFASQLNQRRGGSLGIGVSVPILDRGAVSIARQRALVQLENENLVLRDQTLGVALEVRRAYLDFLAAQEQLAASGAQQRSAALALEAAQARYRVGLATFVEVTLARATLIQAQSAVVNARSSLTFQQSLMSYYTGVLDPANVRLGG